MHHKNASVPSLRERPKISIAALMGLAVWCRRRLEEDQGDDPCTTPRMNDEPAKKTRPANLAGEHRNPREFVDVNKRPHTSFKRILALSSEVCQPRKKGAHRVALKQLWKSLPISERNEIGQLLAQMLTRKILPPKSEEGSNE